MNKVCVCVTYLYFNEHSLPETYRYMRAHTIRHVQTRPFTDVSRLASIPSEIRCGNEINRFELQQNIYRRLMCDKLYSKAIFRTLDNFTVFGRVFFIDPLLSRTW